MNKFLARIFSYKSFSRFAVRDQILFAKRLSILTKAGIPITESLRMLESQTNSQALKRILTGLISDVENGQFLSASLAQHQNLVGEFAINIIQIGEVSGTLPQNLNHLAEELKKKQALKRKILGALIYPIFIIVATFGITALLTVFVFPKILPIFKGIDFGLPWSTRVLIAVSNIFLRHGFAVLVGTILILVLVWLLFKIKTVKFWFDRIILSTPLLKRISQGYHMGNFCRTLGLLLKSEVTIVKAITITAQTTTNLAYRKELFELAQILNRGQKLSSHMHTNSALFPPMLTQMVRVGEATGNLSETLLYLAEVYENEVDELTKNLANILEPVLMVIMGIIVGFVAISIITPIYQITQHIHP